jgi:metal-dependent amidase/aminoacylase/carboxypeptidase family protein
MEGTDVSRSSPVPVWNELFPRVILSIDKAISDADDQLRAISADIHAHPELAWEEHHAHDVLSDFMESRGFTVVRHAYNLATAWTATYEIGSGGKTIGFNSESQ